MPRTAPLTRARTAASRNGTRNQVGSRVASVPIGSAATPSRISVDEPARARPKHTRSTGASAPPKVFQKTMPRVGGVAALVARPVGGDVDPAETEAGHHHDQRADHGLRRAGGDRADGVPVDVVDGHHDVDDRDRAGDPREDRLQPHDHVVARDACRHDERRDDGRCDDLRGGAAAPAEPVEDRGGGEHREDRQERLPPDRDQPGDDPGELLPGDPERRAAQDHRRRRAALAGDRDDPAQGERHDDADDGDEHALPERDAEVEDERRIAQPEHRHVGREPRPEQVGGRGCPLGLGDDLDAGGLDPRRLPGHHASVIGVLLPCSPSVRRAASSGPSRPAVCSAAATTSARVGGVATALDGRDRREAGHLHRTLSRRDRFRHRRHADDVGSDAAHPLGLGGGVVVRPDELRIDALGERPGRDAGRSRAAGATRRR